VSSELNYSLLDRIVHRLAFSSRAVQVTAADVEASLWGERFRHIPVERPVFITSLPRAGTTLLLEILSQWPGLATHRYRDMPFVMAPLFWDRLSGRFRKSAVMSERAHGDGMTVGYDSPEAFEEVLWRVHWPDKYEPDRILMWSEAEEAEDFRDGFVQHMQKIIALRAADDEPPPRYISKNNANIARIGLLKRLFPDALVLIPFRHPVDQAASLRRQHAKFLALHRKEPFSKRYMRDIGHLEFGALHRPIAFDGTDDLFGRYRPDSLDYWLAYWIGAFRHIAIHRDQVILLSYEAACRDGATALRALVDRLGIAQTGPLESLATLFKTPTRYGAAEEAKEPTLVDRAEALHAQLLELSLV